MAIIGPELNSVEFQLFSSDKIRELSVVEIKTPLCFNALGHPLKNGLYDLAMGPSGSMTDPCTTCKQIVRYCFGHFGHFELPCPVVNPLFHKPLFSILRMSCPNCFKILLPPQTKLILVNQLKLLNAGLVVQAQELDQALLGIAKKENAEPEALESLTADCVERFMSKEVPGEIEPDPQSSKVVEALRQQFISHAIKQLASTKTCSYCKAPIKKVTALQNKIFTTVSKVEIADKFKESGDVTKNRIETKLILPDESRQRMRSIWTFEKGLLQAMFPVLTKTEVEHPTDLFFMDVILVPPPRTRPVNYVNGQMVENSHTRSYKAILNVAIVMRNIIKAVQDGGFTELNPDYKVLVAAVRGETPVEKLHQSWLELQSDVDHLLDADMNKLTQNTMISGLKQIIEKKEGILRMHMMGKRVNFAARTVITPDPNVNIEEIGLPEHFAMRLSYPVPVNYCNVNELRTMVQNGPDIYPGAVIVENEDGSQIRLIGGKENKTKRNAIAKQLLKSLGPDQLGSKIVHRHLINGDMLLLNRQPTLHKPSIMAHKARILRGEKTLRLHYSNCKAYNADFDGDEMNVHCPQSEVARSEAYNIVNVSNQYLVPKDGSPLGGLIQDHVIAGVRLTLRGQFFEKENYHQLVYQGLSSKVGILKLLPPCIICPKPLWSGKQVISTILINLIPDGKELISLNSSAKIGFKSWEMEKPREWNSGTPFKDPKTMSESEVIIRNGQLLCGVLDKQHYGATTYGLVHCLFELYGGSCSSSFLDALGKVFTYFLQLRGFTIGVEDILVLSKADKKRTHIIKKARKIGNEAACKALDLEEPAENLRERLEAAFFKEGPRFRGRLDQEYKSALDEYTNSINKVCLPSGLIMKFPDNNLQLMVTSGAKGSTVNTMQISCLLGQIELEGRRPPVMISGRSLPSFMPFETIPRAGGYIDGRFLTGIKPQEFFFHCMAGREGLIDTAVKTSRSGYLQRCLIKHLEGVAVAYDNTVRDHDGSIIQFAYGEDGLDITKSTFLNKKQMDFLYNNKNCFVDKSILRQLKESEDLEGIEKHRKKVEVWNLMNTHNKPKPPFTRFSQCVQETIAEKYFKKRKSTENKLTIGMFKSHDKMVAKWMKCSEEERKQYEVERCPDPVTSVYRAGRDIGVVTEKIDKLIADYLEEKFKGDMKKKEMKNMKKSVKNMMHFKYMRALCDPGEPVGVLAAQSIGEPSTQMTLNTFHFAGRGEMNVTLGIPRLREILMTASKTIKTPNMEVPFLKGVPKLEKKADTLKRAMRRVTVSDVLEKILVTEQLELGSKRTFDYSVRFEFLPHKCYKGEFIINPKTILKHMEKKFLILFSSEIRKLGKSFGDIVHVSHQEKQSRSKKYDDDDDEDEPPELKDQRGVEEAHESSDEDNELDDDDATKAKLRTKHQEGQEYDEEDSEKEKTDDEEEVDKEEQVGEQGEKMDEVDIKPNDAMLASIESRVNQVLETFSLVKKYSYDADKEEWCEVVIGLPVTMSKLDFSTLLRELCEKSVIYQIPNLKRAILCKNQNGDLTIKTEGIDIIEMFKYNRLLDLNRLYSNDIHKIADTYGIEAGSRVIVKELKNVFGVYGITVDPRHLLLIADYMTHEGVFRPLNRGGMADSPSPLQQMSFESSIGFLRNAVLQGKTDTLQSPSARIMIGRCCYSGTGSFELK